jgi:tetraacyldisaccharide 4'-kinase
VAGDTGVAAAPLRGVLHLASIVYRQAVRARNRKYDHPESTTWLDVPVISIGNLTTGGTGKTPIVMDIARRLRAAGHQPAVVSRGYKSGPRGDADELLMIRRRLPDVPCVADPDRIAGARRAIREYGANVIVLDDGFQHRRIGRDLDIVVIDATCPFGYGHMLPRGLLREPLAGLRRASMILLSRTDQVPAQRMDEIHAALDRLAPAVPRVRTTHRPTGLVRLDSSNPQLDAADVGRAFCFAAIGNPAAFRGTVSSFGIDIAGVRWWPDHHAYSESDASVVQDLARRASAAVLLTTEKDAVKLTGLGTRWEIPVYALQIEIDFPTGDDTILASALTELMTARRGSRDRPVLQTG